MHQDPLEQLKQVKKLIIVSLISLFILVYSNNFFKNDAKKSEQSKKTEKIENSDIEKISNAKNEENNKKERSEAIKDLEKSNKIIKFSNNTISGLINLNGLKIENIKLENYLDDKKNPIHLFSPSDSEYYYYLDFGWIAENNIKVPTKDTQWKFKKDTKDGTKIALETIINNVNFSVSLDLNEKYLWSVEMKATKNNTNINLKNYIRIKRNIEHTGPKKQVNLHEGVTYVTNKIMNEIKYADIKKKNTSIDAENESSWIGFEDKYWFSGIITEDSNAIISYQKTNCENCYQISVLSNENEYKLYTGAKEFDEIKRYQEKYKIDLFDRVIDFGWFYILTKPILILIKTLYNMTGNFGVAIICMTIIIRLLLFPLANKSYKSMTKMKNIAPKIQELKEKYKDDKKTFNLNVVELYKKEKINPASGCLPILIQIPVFFALYKVLIVSIEMRNAPFIFWLKDLSEQDPTSIFNLFGLLPYGVPEFFKIGVLPVLMGITLFIQQKFNPKPTDPAQAKMMQLLPLIFTFLFANFPSGLVLYWTVNNILSVLQQYLISKKYSQ